MTLLQEALCCASLGGRHGFPPGNQLHRLHQAEEALLLEFLASSLGSGLAAVFDHFQ